MITRAPPKSAEYRLGEGKSLVAARRETPNLFPTIMIGLVTVMGCGPRLGGADGTVTCGGRPLPGGRVTFLCDGGKRPAVSAMISEGRYEVVGLPVGHARIMVETFPPANTTSSAQTAPGGLPTLATPDEKQPPGSYVRIPDRYKQPHTSGLEITIRTGRQVYDIDLDP